MNVIYDASGSEFRLIDGNSGGGGSSAGHNNSTNTSVALGKDSSQTAVNQIIIQSGTNTIDAPAQEGFYVNPLRDIHDLSSNGSNSHSIYYDLDSHEIFFNTSLTTNNSTGTSLVLGAGASSTAGDQIVLQSGNQVVNAPNNSGFFVNPVRDISSGSGLMEVRYNHSTNEFRYISSSGTVTNNSTDKSLALGAGSSSTTDNQIILQSGNNTIDAPNQEGLYINPLRDIQDNNSNGSNPHPVYYDPNSHEVYFNTGLITNNSTGNSLALGAGSSSATDNQIILQSGNSVINAPNHEGFFVNPVRSTNSYTGLMNVIYDTSTSELLIVDGTGSGAGATYNNSTSKSVALGDGSAPTNDDQIILQSGDSVINAPNHHGFFVNPVRSSSHTNGLMEVRYDAGTSEFRIIDGTANALVHESGTVSLPNLPTSDPTSVGQVWNDSGYLRISSG
jgi:hypothetical protein